MRLVLCAVGQKMPAWADEAYEDFAKRFPPEMRLELKAVKAEPRTTGKSTEQLMAAEAQRLDAACPKGARRVVLDEHGERVTSKQLAQRLETWRGDGRDVAIFIGGPDGLDGSIKSRADEKLRLSDLTLPHAFVRVLLAEGLYRAWSVMEGHPYHRE
ncbi:23S rRNA (pseudouridine(1915)-N(3))-methyltransferase RlmH [Roseateles sp. UC29_93]|uniref:23S rRNA (pseudouridine(1915)-N(3))-methyltransferase RlmH n=1 Tax=Roseateles sp. UC29_93 TaxID=3350177 RepID=UPI003670F9CB